MKHTKIFNLLQKIAETVEPVAQARIASCLVYKNDIISIGINKNKTHPMQKRYGKNSKAIYLHSEIDTIINALRDYDPEVLIKSKLYILRVKRPESSSKAFIWGLAKPCSGCQHAIEQFGIKSVYYSTDEGTFEEL